MTQLKLFDHHISSQLHLILLTPYTTYIVISNYVKSDTIFLLQMKGDFKSKHTTSPSSFPLYFYLSFHGFATKLFIHDHHGNRELPTDGNEMPPTGVMQEHNENIEMSVYRDLITAPNMLMVLGDNIISPNSPQMSSFDITMEHACTFSQHFLPP